MGWFVRSPGRIGSSNAPVNKLPFDDSVLGADHADNNTYQLLWNHGAGGIATRMLESVMGDSAVITLRVRFPILHTGNASMKRSNSSGISAAAILRRRTSRVGVILPRVSPC